MCIYCILRQKQLSCFKRKLLLGNIIKFKYCVCINGGLKMGLNLKDAMNIGGLKKCKVLADKVKLSEEIKNVTIMEVPDVTRWLKGGELLLTSFLAQQNSKEQKKLIKQLHQNKITDLAIKPYHYLGEITEFIIEEEEKYNKKKTKKKKKKKIK